MPVPGTISGLGEFSSMICFSSSASITSFSISRAARASSAGRRAARIARTFSIDSSMMRLHFLVDLAGGLLAVAALAREIAAAGQERRAIALAIVHAAQPAHAVIHHHAAGDVAGPFQIVLRAGRNVVEDHFLGDRAGQQHLDAAFQLALRHQVAIAFGPLHRVAQRGRGRGE